MTDCDSKVGMESPAQSRFVGQCEAQTRGGQPQSFNSFTFIPLKSGPMFQIFHESVRVKCESKVGSLDNIGHVPGGGNVKVALISPNNGTFPPLRFPSLTPSPPVLIRFRITHAVFPAAVMAPDVTLLIRAAVHLPPTSQKQKTLCSVRNVRRDPWK